MVVSLVVKKQIGDGWAQKSASKGESRKQKHDQREGETSRGKKKIKKQREKAKAFDVLSFLLIDLNCLVARCSLRNTFVTCLFLFFLLLLVHRVQGSLAPSSCVFTGARRLCFF